MKRYNKRDAIDQKPSLGLPLLLIFFLVIIIAALVIHFQHQKNFSVIKINGKGTAINLSKSYGFVLFSSGNTNKGAILAEEGDLLAFNNTFLEYKNIRQDSIHIDDTGDSLVFVNGKVNTIILSDREDLLPWFSSMKEKDIEALEMLYFTSVIPPGYIPYLKEIARIKPNTSLAFEMEDSLNIIASYFKHAAFFDPRLVIVSITEKDLPMLKQWKNTECIYLDLQDSVVKESLPELPTLQQCILTGDNSISASFFQNNPQLEKLTILGQLQDYSLIKPLRNLRELVINNEEPAIDLSSIKNVVPNLSVLVVSGSCINIDSLVTPENLQWLGLPDNISQRQFNTLATSLNNLKVLELTGGDSITDLSALQKLTNLRGLVITDTVTDKASLHALRDLRYLSLPVNNHQDSLYLKALEKSLPGCIIVPNGGACLGSGWLLLLFPLLLFLSIVNRSKWIKGITFKSKTNELS